MAKRGVDDAMFCEACGTHRDQLGLAGDEMRDCPECGRSTCSNCWNQIAGTCLTCRAFALPVVAASAPPPRLAVPAAAVTANAITKRTAKPRAFKRAAKPQPDAVVTRMPGIVEAAPPSTLASASSRAARFGTIRIGRVVRATAIGSVLAVSIAAVVFAGVIRLGPSPAPRAADETPGGPVSGPYWSNPGPTDESTPATTDPGRTTVPARPNDHQATGADPGAGPGSGTQPTDGRPNATIEPTATSTATPGPFGTATPTDSPPPTPTADPATPTPDPPTPTPDPPTPTPDPPTPTPDPPTPTPDPPTPTPDPTP